MSAVTVARGRDNGKACFVITLGDPDDFDGTQLFVPDADAVKLFKALYGMLVARGLVPVLKEKRSKP